MKPEFLSRRLLGITRSKAKMYEYGVPEDEHIDIPRDPARLFSLAVGLLGDLSAQNRLLPLDDPKIVELRKNLTFSACFFDAYLSSRLDEELDPYLLLLGSAAYYLCDLPGSAAVLADRLGEACPDVGGAGLERLLHWVLAGNFTTNNISAEGHYGALAGEIAARLRQHRETGEAKEELLTRAEELAQAAYATGIPRHLLLGDVTRALIQRRLENSVWHCLPTYSELDIDAWRGTLTKPSFVQELWPAQHLLGESGVFHGVSAVVQMPTSAGKTKATEIIIRSAFFSDRTSLVVVVAPYRALCHEIHNSYARTFRGESVRVSELSDVLQEDFELGSLPGTRNVLVLTPEKFLYVLRHNPELAGQVGLLIYDEGHQFDAGARGVTFELLTASLNRMIPDDAQVVLISAVITNARAIADWMGGEKFTVVSGTRLLPTHRTVGFASWRDRRGRLEFVQEENPDEIEFFVPRVIEAQDLELRGRERKRRVFPKKEDSGSIAAYLGLKLVSQGSVAVFCGTKATASGLCASIAEAFDRGFTLGRPSASADEGETERLAFLHECHLGPDADATRAARLGVFAHHGNTPHGLRLAIEYAMQKGLARFVVCTSTLAQGVNLPIRYLVVRGLYQGRQRIRIRDFQNLIGRAGRSGMHTEGSVLFADPAIFEKRRSRSDGWRWEHAKELLAPENSEPCSSALLAVLEPLRSDDRKRKITDSRLLVVKEHVSENGRLDGLAARLVQRFAGRGYSEANLADQIARKRQTISAIESYLMTHGDEDGPGLDDGSVVGLAKDTLAYFLADDDEKPLIIELFTLLASHISQVVPEPARRRAIGRTLLGVRESAMIEEWVRGHAEQLLGTDDQEQLLSLLWPILSGNINNFTFMKCSVPELLLEIAVGWIRGIPFYELLGILEEANARIGGGERPRHPKIDHVIDICENALAYEGSLVLGAVCEMADLLLPDNHESLIAELEILQKRLKYGVASSSAIMLHEIGFADRIVASELALALGTGLATKGDTRNVIRQNAQEVRDRLRRYPTYFVERLEHIAHK